MQQIHNFATTLKMMRYEAEVSAHLKHLNVAQERAQHLVQNRQFLKDLHPDHHTDALQSAYEISLRRAEIEWQYWSHLQSLKAKALSLHDTVNAQQDLLQLKQHNLAGLPELPSLDLQEQAALIQSLMCQAAEQYVDQALALVEPAA